MTPQQAPADGCTAETSGGAHTAVHKARHAFTSTPYRLIQALFQRSALTEGDRQGIESPFILRSPMSATLHLLLHLRVLTETELQSRASMHVLREAVTSFKTSVPGTGKLGNTAKSACRLA